MSWICPKCNSENADYIIEGIKKTECLCGYKMPMNVDNTTDVDDNDSGYDSTQRALDRQALDEIFGETQEVRQVSAATTEESKKRFRDVILERLMELPSWFILGLAGLGIFWIIPSFIRAWGERRFVAAFAEILVASAFYLIILIAPLWLGIFAGKKTAQKYGHNWLGWVVGIVVVVAVYVLINNLANQIPGVGWRFRKIMDAEIDY